MVTSVLRTVSLEGTSVEGWKKGTYKTVEIWPPYLSPLFLVNVPLRESEEVRHVWNGGIYSRTLLWDLYPTVPLPFLPSRDKEVVISRSDGLEVDRGTGLPSSIESGGPGCLDDPSLYNELISSHSVWQLPCIPSLVLSTHALSSPSLFVWT